IGLLAPCLLLGACSIEDRSEKVFITVEGSVMSSPDDTPVSGATVILGTGGYLSGATVLDFATTDPGGRYRIEHEVAYYPAPNAGECELWLTATARGYEVVPGGGVDGGYAVPCTEGDQTIDILRRTPDEPNGSQG